jgi:hypothetical protein
MTQRLTSALAAAAAALGTTAILASSGSAQTQPTTLHLVAKHQRDVGFQPQHAPRQGDRVGFGSNVSGDDSGYDRELCTLIGNVRSNNPAAKIALCTEQLQLAKGTLTAQGLLPRRARDTPLAITGGTGAYDGARGTAIATNVSNNETRIAITLLP